MSGLLCGHRPRATRAGARAWLRPGGLSVPASVPSAWPRRPSGCRPPRPRPPRSRRTGPRPSRPGQCSKRHGPRRTRRSPAAAPWRRAGRGRALQGQPRARLLGGPTPRPGPAGRQPRCEVSLSAACGRRRSPRPAPPGAWRRPPSWPRGWVPQERPGWWQWGGGACW